MKVLWLSPNLNHYKVNLLYQLHLSSEIDITVIIGTGRKNMGDKYEYNIKFDFVKTGIEKAKFGYSRKVRKILKKYFHKNDWVLIPREKKNILLILYAIFLREITKYRGKHVRLISYNHPISTSNNNTSGLIDKIFTKLYYKLFDRIIFYTKKSYECSVKTGLINKGKAFWANNTISTIDIERHYKFSYPNLDELTILFIGRLIPTKRLDLLFSYYKELKIKFNIMNRKINLIIIGDGPGINIVKKYSAIDSSIKWKGALIAEKKIAPIMKKSTIVFVPGISGLSINHTFAYGRPYITFQFINHPPEISYIINDYNGFILGNNFEQNVEFIFNLLNNKNKINSMCDNALKTSYELSSENWVNQIIIALKK